MKENKKLCLFRDVEASLSVEVYLGKYLLSLLGNQTFYQLALSKRISRFFDTFSRSNAVCRTNLKSCYFETNSTSSKNLFANDKLMRTNFYQCCFPTCWKIFECENVRACK